MMEGDPRVEKYMYPIAQAIKKSMNGGFSSDVYNRAYEAVMNALDENKSECARLSAELEVVKAERKWISVDERLPEEGKRVLILFENGAVKIGHHWKTSQQWATDDGCYYHGASYSWVIGWRPLPQPPQEVE
jgi:hypothetical protein